ncbi:hypothetical protein AKJ39_02845 [candidate division MSBL1 archaeon SCGC-AAA259J03]|uniref:Uncharacterized protein n=1 Tax=candidate division MSBL1 archaeon SCGC-AAA259J03 TaxID=1698269 RepID=A0A656YXY0_9EURY|nr:hypothetical protein AKJ39_02845 [candidate division MSBL1 archaeon SCGC-AAA259J03]
MTVSLKLFHLPNPLEVEEFKKGWARRTIGDWKVHRECRARARFYVGLDTARHTFPTMMQLKTFCLEVSICGFACRSLPLLCLVIRVIPM